MPRHPAPNAPDAANPSGGARSASLADVAALAGVSTGTVSRALSKPDMISEATRVRVMSAAERLGYVANGAARALAMRRSMTVGALVPRFGGSSFPTMIQALETTLAAAGYTLLLSAPEHERRHDPSYLRALLERGVDGIALLGIELEPHVFTMLAAHRTPYVLMWALPGLDDNVVTFDELEAGERLVAHLAEQGHRRIGFIGARHDDNHRARRRFQGLTQAISKRDITLCENAMVETEYGFRQGFDAMAEIMRRKPSVSAVVCGNDYLAAGALSALDHAGIEVPRSLSIASFNDNEFAPYLHPPLTTVRLPIREIGELAGQLLLSRLAGKPYAAPPLLPVQLIVRGSTAAPARTSAFAASRGKKA